MKNLYIRAMESAGDAPSWKKDWRWIGLLCLCVYGVVLAFRLSFAGRWDHPELWVNGERILATHDSYFWLAKAKGVGTMAFHPLAELTNFLHTAFGLSFGGIGFWTPAFMGALVGVVCCLWGWMIGGRHAGIMAGLVGSLTPGFFYRSRLGYFDTDLFTLLMPMAIAWMLAFWSSRHMKSGWLIHRGDDEGKVAWATSLWMAFGFGVVTRYACIWHHDILNVAILYYFMTIVVLLVNGRPGHRNVWMYGLAVYALAAFPGAVYGNSLALWPFSALEVTAFGLSHNGTTGLAGIVLSGLLVLGMLYLHKRHESIARNTWVCCVVFVLTILSVQLIQGPIESISMKLYQYFRSAGPGAGEIAAEPMGPMYPSIMQSIREAKLVEIGVILERGAFFSWLGWLALLVAPLMVAVRPAAIFLLPLVALQLLSITMGIRFSMFGGAALLVLLGAGIAWGVSVVLRAMDRRWVVVVGVQVLLGGALLAYSHAAYSKLSLTPVIPRMHAEALVELKEKSPEDAMIWTWWDWGYASQYFALRDTVIDGGKHAGRDVYPVAFAMSSSSSEKSHQMIRFSSQFPAQGPYEFGLYPARAWDDVPRDSVRAVLAEQLADKSYPATAKQYLVVTWNDLTVARWISYFGTWNLETGTSSEFGIVNYDPGQLGYNLRQGAVMDRRGGGGLVSDIYVLTKDGKAVNHHYFMNTLSPKLVPDRHFVLLNEISRQGVLMDRSAHRSMMMRLLVEDPNDPEISKYFKLVVDKLPFARIYEVVQ